LLIRKFKASEEKEWLRGDWRVGGGGGGRDTNNFVVFAFRPLVIRPTSTEGDPRPRVVTEILGEVIFRVLLFPRVSILLQILHTHIVLIYYRRYIIFATDNTVTQNTRSLSPSLYLHTHRLLYGAFAPMLLKYRQSWRDGSIV
jgi:hypothetical protein